MELSVSHRKLSLFCGVIFFVSCLWTISSSNFYFDLKSLQRAFISLSRKHMPWSHYSSVPVILPIPPRRMWGWGAETGGEEVGYCGEAAFQSVMLYAGNYVSQEQVYLAGNATFLLGHNDALVCQVFHLHCTRWPSSPNTTAVNVLAYVRTQIDANLPLLIGTYSLEPAPNDLSFDHTLPFIGYRLDTASGLVDTIYYNDMYQLITSRLNCSINIVTGQPRCYRDRTAATALDQPRQPWQQFIPNITNVQDPPGSAALICTLVITGNEDPNGELYPLVLRVAREDEPDSGSEDQLSLAPVLLSAEVEMSGLTVGSSYVLLRFDNASLLPPGNFLASKSFARSWQFTSATVTYNVTLTGDSSFLTNGTYFFRVVDAGIDRLTPSASYKYIDSVVNVNPLALFGTSAVPSSQCPGVVAVPTDLHCGVSVHRNWLWSFFVNNQQLLCIKVVFTVAPPSSTISSFEDTCLWIDVSSVDGNIVDNGGNSLDVSSNTPQGTQAFFDASGRLYTDNVESWWFTTYSTDMIDGVYWMRSQDGQTVSSFTPV